MRGSLQVALDVNALYGGWLPTVTGRGEGRVEGC